jgi:rubrerythrin
MVSKKEEVKCERDGHDYRVAGKRNGVTIYVCRRCGHTVEEKD